MALPGVFHFEFYHRLSKRERVLVLLVGGAVFILLNLIALRTLIVSFKELNRTRSEKALAIETSGFYVREEPLWQERVKWMREKQPVLQNRDVLGVQLQNQIKKLADQHKVILSGQSILPPASGQVGKITEYQALIVQIDAKSDWGSMVRFIYSLQKPENFIAFESASLKTDPNDKLMIMGRFQIAKWYAPAAR
jgi:hypothetical protein